MGNLARLAQAGLLNQVQDTVRPFFLDSPDAGLEDVLGSLDNLAPDTHHFALAMVDIQQKYRTRLGLYTSLLSLIEKSDVELSSTISGSQDIDPDLLPDFYHVEDGIFTADEIGWISCPLSRTVVLSTGRVLKKHRGKWLSKVEMDFGPRSTFYLLLEFFVEKDVRSLDEITALVEEEGLSENQTRKFFQQFGLGNYFCSGHYVEVLSPTTYQYHTFDPEENEEVREYHLHLGLT